MEYKSLTYKKPVYGSNFDPQDYLTDDGYILVTVTLPTGEIVTLHIGGSIALVENQLALDSFIHIMVDDIENPVLDGETFQE